MKRSIAAVCIFAVFFGNFYIFWGKAYAYSSKGYLIPDAIQGEAKITIPDKDDVIRIDTDNSLSNAGMFWNIPCIHAFHSIVPASIVNFYEFIGETRSVSSKIPEQQYALRSFLSVHWYFDRIGSSDTFGDSADPTAKTLMPGYTYYDTMAGYEVWENQYYIPLGFVYDSYITESQIESVANSRKVQAMLKGVLLTDEQVMRLQDLLQPCDELAMASLTESAYYRDARERAQKTVKDVTITRTGFTASADFSKEEFVFFSVPWEEGWTASVNGEPVAIEKVNVGFMGIRVPVGAVQIEFTYRTPGLTAGACLTGGGLALLAGWILLGRCWDKKRAAKQEKIVREEETDGNDSQTASEV